MAMNSTYGQGLINAINQGKSVVFPEAPYLGLLVKVDLVNPANCKEISYPEYFRLPVEGTGLEGKVYMATATSAEGKDEDAGKLVHTALNQERIVFPPNETGVVVTADDGTKTFEDGSSCSVIGWGYYADKTGGSPYLWGYLKMDEDGNPVPVVIEQNTFPTFLKSQFKMTAK